MQKPKNLLPGLFLCVFSRTAEPLVNFYCSNFWIFPIFYLGQTFFAGKKGVSGPFYTGSFCAPIPQKTPCTPRLYKHAALFGMPPRPTKGPPSARPNRLKTILLGPCTANLALFTHTKGPTQKTPGVIPGVWLMKSSFNLLLTHCGRFLAGCTGPACSRRPQ